MGSSIYVRDIWHKYHSSYFKIVSNFFFSYKNFETSLVVFRPNITTNHAISSSNTFLNSLRKNDFEDKVEGKGLGSPVIDDCTQL